MGGWGDIAPSSVSLLLQLGLRTSDGWDNGQVTRYLLLSPGNDLVVIKASQLWDLTKDTELDGTGAEITGP